jgi:hypothetical protein
MNGGPSHVDTFDPKPLLEKYAGKELPTGQSEDRAADRRRLAFAVFVPEIRPERHRGQRVVRQDGRIDRRDRRDPLDVRRRAEPRTVVAADELRRRAADPAQRRIVGHLRAGHREPEPAGVRGHVSRRLPDPGIAELAGRFPAGDLPGHLHRHPAHGDRAADRTHPQPADHAAQAASAAGPAGAV